MTEFEKAGLLHVRPSGRWAICRPGSSGELFRVDVNGELQIRRIEYGHDGRGYYAVGE
jgi:hypothetical protein